MTTQESLPTMMKRLSSSSIHSLANMFARSSCSTSSPSIQFSEGDVEVVTEEGLPHAKMKLEARHVAKIAITLYDEQL